MDDATVKNSESKYPDFLINIDIPKSNKKVRLSETKIPKILLDFNERVKPFLTKRNHGPERYR